MKILTILFTTLFLMGCRNSDTATTEDATAGTQQEVTEATEAADVNTEAAADTDATEDAAKVDSTAGDAETTEE